MSVGTSECDIEGDWHGCKGAREQSFDTWSVCGHMRGARPAKRSPMLVYDKIQELHAMIVRRHADAGDKAG